MANAFADLIPKKGAQKYRPLVPGERRANADGSHSTEVLRGVSIGGQVANVPSLWKDGAGNIVDFGDRSDDELAEIASGFEKQSGKKFRRFGSFDEATSIARKRSAAGGVSAEDQFPLYANGLSDAAGKTKKAVPGVAESSLLGAGEGLSFGWLDEIVGLADEDAGKALKERLASAREAHPIATGLGEVGGVLASSLAVPGSAVARGASLGTKVVTGARTGAITGGAFGAGTAEGDIEERLKGGAKGAAFGGGVGAAAPVVLKLAGLAAKTAAKPLRIASGTEREASRRVAEAIRRDTGGQSDRAVQILESARRKGAPMIAADIGETTRAVARSAANTSPEARAVLHQVVSERFGTQNIRAATVLTSLVRTPANANVTRETLEEAARTARAPFYKRAYHDGADGIWNDDLQTLSQSPVMEKAMRDAAVSIKNKVATGRAMEAVSPTGKPTLEYWDQVQRNLRSAWNVAKRAGDTEAAADLAATRSALIGQLDNAVPSFATARGVAKSLFDAEDALEAGEKFVTSPMKNVDARKALAKMTPEERMLFREGFVSKFIDNVMSSNDRRTILNQINASPAARQRMEVALGSGAYKKMEAFLLVEDIMDKTRQALQGNSTTVRQLVEMGLAGGAGFALSGGLTNFDSTAILTGILAAGSRKGLYLLDQRVARRVGEMLASEDPQSVLKAVEVAGGGRFIEILRKAGDMVARAVIPLQPRGPLEITVPVGAEQSQPAGGGH